MRSERVFDGGDVGRGLSRDSFTQTDISVLAIYKEFHVFQTSRYEFLVFPFLIFILILYLVEFISRPKAPESILLYVGRINRYYE